MGRIHQNYIPELDGIRGMAILLVVTYHYFGGYFYFFSFGWTGVDLFFVLSGYLITSRLINTRNDHNYFSKFYKNRALRIMPLYYSVLIVFYVLINFFVSKENIAGFRFYNQNVLSFFLFLENWSFIKANPIYENQLLHFWSLAVEEQFYILWPLFIFLFSKKKHIISILYVIIVAIIFFRTFLYFKSQENYFIYFDNTFCRMDSFIIGGLFYFFITQTSKIRFRYLLPILISILISGIVLSGTKSSTLFMSTIGYTLLAVFFGILIYLAVQQKNNYLKTFLNQKWLINLGKISYGLYIFHWIVLRFLEGKIINYLNSHFSILEQLALWISLFTCLMISIFVSIISYFYFELYFLKQKVH